MNGILSHYICMCEYTRMCDTHLFVAFALFSPPPIIWSCILNIIAVLWKDELVCECFHVLVSLNCRWKAADVESGRHCWSPSWATKYFPNHPPPFLVLQWDSLPPVIDMLLKYSSCSYTHTSFPCPHAAPLGMKPCQGFWIYVFSEHVFSKYCMQDITLFRVLMSATCKMQSCAFVVTYTVWCLCFSQQSQCKTH